MPERPLVSLGFLEVNLADPVEQAMKRAEEELILEESDTKPLENVSIYRGLVARLDIVKLGFQNDLESGVVSQSFQTEDFSKSLHPDLTIFLDNDSKQESTPLVLSLYHEGKGRSWLTLEKEDRKVAFIFDQTVNGVLLERNHNTWVESGRIERDVERAALRILDVAVNKATSVNGARAA